jgi:LysM repeat protein
MEPDSEQESAHSTPPNAPRRERDAVRRALPWLVAAMLLVVLAGAAGLGTAYLVASFRAAPSPDAAFLPMPTARPSPSPVGTVSPTEAPSETPTAQPTAQPTATQTATQTADASPEPTPAASPLEYTVRQGDSISRIALRHNVTPEAIVSLNNLRNPNRIFPGQVLLIPAPSASPTP